MKSIVYISIFLSLFSCRKFHQEKESPVGSWEKTKYTGLCLEKGLMEAISFQINENIFIGLGHTSSLKLNKQFYKFTINSGWERTNDIPPYPGKSFIRAIAITIKDKVYIGLGSYLDIPNTSYEYPKDFWVFDINTKTWSKFPWEFPGEGRVDATAFVINDKGYIGAGLTPKGMVNDFYELDPEKGWLKIDSLDIPRSQCSAFTTSQSGFIICGYSSGDNIYLPYFSTLDPNRKTWQNIIIPKDFYPDLQRSDATTFTLTQNGREYVYITGGINHHDIPVASCLKYDATTNTWFREKDFPGNPQNTIGFTINNRAFIVNTEQLETWEFVIE